MSNTWISSVVGKMGAQCKQRLAGPGEPEAAIRGPIEDLLSTAGEYLSLVVVPHAEVSDTERGVRPDYAISVAGAITGYVEVKRPGANLDPESFNGHNLTQWQRQRDLPNLIYTNGTDWRLYRDGQPVGDPVHLSGGPLREAGQNLTCTADFEELITDFLRWKPDDIKSVVSLVRAIAPLCRLLRGEVIDQLKAEQDAIDAGADAQAQPFQGLARDWRQLLFPTAEDHVFADGYAQTVTFALLLARTENIDLQQAGGLHNIGTKLAGQHSLMARALQLLTDHVAADFRVTLDLLVRVVDAVDWPAVRAGNRDTYLHLYERFLDVYDPELRRLSGSYYTPHQVVSQMVRLTNEVLVTRLGRADGFADESVVVVDPAMGTGTYLNSVIEQVVAMITERDGQGAAAAVITQLARRLYGFELQMGPFAVAELRVTDLLADIGAALPPTGLGMYVTDTLEDPYAEQSQLGSGLQLIAEARKEAAKVKANTPVMVVIGNPPYRERAEGMGHWVENGSGAADDYRPLDDFRAIGNGRTEYVLKNLYVYFWRWATWKVFDANPDLPNADTGVVCYITTSGYLRGPGFKGMREYLRRTATEGWIIDVSPEGMRPDVSTRIFPGVQQPLAIALFTRGAGCDPHTPAAIHYTAISGTRTAKYQALTELTLDSDAWRPVRTTWQAPFTPEPLSSWDDYPALNDLIPWTAPGVKANRNWVTAPDKTVLRERLKTLVAEADGQRKSLLFKETQDRQLSSTTVSLGSDTEQNTTRQFSVETIRYPANAAFVRVGYRSFDRQWIVADHRLIDRARPDLWAARVPGQIFAVELHSSPISDGPGVVFSALIPDMHYFKGSEGGRVLPLLHPGGRANLAEGLLGALEFMVGHPVSADDVAAYIAGVAAHSGYTQRFADELTTPGIRVPITTDFALFDQAVALGREVIWLHTYGDIFAENRGGGGLRLPVSDLGRVLNHTAVSAMPETIAYDSATQTIQLGTGTFGPVSQQVWDYTVGGKKVIRAWFNYRKKTPTGRQTSPLDTVHVDAWPSDWNAEFIDLLSVLTRLVRIHPDQEELLEQILDRPVASRADLTALGVRWPAGNTDTQRRPDTAAPLTEDDEGEGQLGLTF